MLENYLGTGPCNEGVIGLPPKVTTSDVNIAKDTKEFAFKLNTDKTSPAGIHKNLFCQVFITHNGEPELHNLGYSELRIDVPLPPKADAPATPPPAPTPAKVPEPAKAPEKRLTRLEKLRLEQEEREKAAKAGQPPAQKK